MISIMFWNVGGEPRPTQISDLARTYQVDVLLLAEFVDEPADLLRSLNTTDAIYSYAPGRENTRISIFAKFDETFVATTYETDRLTVRRLNPPGIDELLLAVVHFPSKLHWRDESQVQECAILAGDIRRAEAQIGHHRTLLMGDLNMNPFESGVVGAAGMHAVMSRRIARRETRIVQGREYPFFYNPMWNLLGDETPGPAGTFYHPRSEHKVYFWNMFDQVLIRPSLLDRFRMEDLAIIQHTGEQALLTDAGIPNRAIGSDHLPILVRLS
jgi:endonuclease/exonuclease/phosphatase (EEP) superfamily protein YafD